MNKLFVIGNVYADSSDKAKELFGVLQDAGYILGYNQNNLNSAVIMKEIEEQQSEE